jgi:2-polyprenyl-6-methoxyphenol hydroxylase-like FAD-dependent oxidoreductase
MGEIDFVIVGGGIGGAVLAEQLGRAGKNVLVLEKRAGPPDWVWPELLWPATTDVLFSLMPKATWEQEAMLAVRGIEFHDGRRVVPFITPELLHEAQVQPWFTHPHRTRELLLRLRSFELRRGVEVRSVLKEKDRIVGVRTHEVATGDEREILGRWTVGDDGVHSAVRKACGIRFETRMFPVDFLCFGFDWPSSLASATARVWLNTKGVASGIVGLVMFPVPNEKGIGLVPVRSKIFDANPEVEESWSRFCSIDAVVHDVMRERKFPQGLFRIRRPWGHAPHYGTEGAILIGDAAHPVSPAGGQGANMSVADACVLAELALRDEPNLLAEYERRRRPANARSMAPTRIAAWVFELPDWCSPTWIVVSLVAGLGWLGRHRRLLRPAIRSGATAFLEKKI